MANSLRSGQITVTTATTAVQGTDVRGKHFMVKALAGNGGLIYVGNDGAGDVTSADYELSADQQLPIYADNLNEIWFDTSNSGDKVCWFRVG